MTSGGKRSSRIVMTNEARVLHELRLHHGLSMRRAGELIGLSDSYIAHVETGRIDPPRGLKLERLLAIYGGIKQKTFYERVRNYSERITPKHELKELVERMSDSKIEILLGIAKSLKP